MTAERPQPTELHPMIRAAGLRYDIPASMADKQEVPIAASTTTSSSMSTAISATAWPGRK